MEDKNANYCDYLLRSFLKNCVEHSLHDGIIGSDEYDRAKNIFESRKNHCYVILLLISA